MARKTSKKGGGVTEVLDEFSQLTGGRVDVIILAVDVRKFMTRCLRVGSVNLCHKRREYDVDEPKAGVD